MWRDTIPMGSSDTIIRFKPSHFPGRMLFHCHTSHHADKGMMAFANISGEYSDPSENSGTPDSGTLDSKTPTTKMPVKTVAYQNCYEMIPEPEDEEPAGPTQPEEPEGPPDNLYPRVQPKPPTKAEKLRAILPYGISGVLFLLGFAIIGYFVYQHRSEKESSFGREVVDSDESSEELFMD
jgi:hypothetical protein